MPYVSHDITAEHDELAAEAYEASGQLAADAINHVADARDLPAHLVDHIIDWFKTTPAYTVKLDDWMAGE